MREGKEVDIFKGRLRLTEDYLNSGVVDRSDPTSIVYQVNRDAMLPAGVSRFRCTIAYAPEYGTALPVDEVCTVSVVFGSFTAVSGGTASTHPFDKQLFVRRTMINANGTYYLS